MAVSKTVKETTAAGRRWFFGTNVMVTIVLCVFVIIGLNWLGEKYSYRKDLTGGFGSARISERTQKILDKLESNIRISTVYTSDEPGKERKEYFPKLQDLCDDIAAYTDKVTIQHVRTGPQRVQLRDDVQSKYSGSSSEYRETVELATQAWTALEAKIQPYRQEIEALLDSDAWLTQFTTVTNLSLELNKQLEDLGQARREVDELVDATQGIPRYKEANDKIKSANDSVKKVIELTQDELKGIHELAQLLSSPDAEFVDATKANGLELQALVTQLGQIVGAPEDQTVPDEPKPVIQKFARAAGQLVTRLMDEKNRIDAFTKDHSALNQHPGWRVQLREMIFSRTITLPELLSQTAQMVSNEQQKVRQFLEQNPPLDQQQTYLRMLREFVPQVTQFVDVWAKQSVKVLGDGPNIDKTSRDFLARSSSGEFFKETLDKLGELSTKIEELPELKLDDVADELRNDNIVVIETDTEVKVLPFDDVWPQADPYAGRIGMGADEGEQRRVFVGDAAISGALLSLVQEKPCATVVITGYEPEMSVPPQMQMQQPPRSISGMLPLDELTFLTKKLEQANFKVVQWNLAKADEEPEIEEGTEAIYLFLPPASPPPQNPMMRMPPVKPFGEEEKAKVKKILAEGGKAIFPVLWMPQPRSPFAPQVKYDYDDILQEDWGIKVDSEYRVIRAAEDRRDPGRYTLNASQLNFMQLNSFTGHPIGKPLQSRRMLMNSVCPVDVLPVTPDGVKVEPLLNVPPELHDVWAASLDEIERIIIAIRTGDGSFVRQLNQEKIPPFSVAVVGTNSKTESKVVVLGTGFSIVDGYLQNRVQRIEGGKNARLVMDPPPVELADLYQNTVYWLAGRDDLIAAGPVSVPMVPAIEATGRGLINGVSLGWAFLVLLVGGMVMMVRRK